MARIVRLGLLLTILGVALAVAPRLTPLPPWFSEERPEPVVLLDRNGGRIAQANPWNAPSDPVGGQRLTMEQIDPLLIHATLATEDRRFYRHPGVDPLALARALRGCIVHGSPLRGASTITMQVVRLSRGQPHGILSRAGEVWWSLVLESHLEKSEILESYLNRAPYGANLRGAGAASWRWFGKPPLLLAPSEAALLAAIPRAPGRLDPLRHPGAARAARDVVLGRMVRCGWLDEAEAERARALPIVLASPGPRNAPHFAAWVLESIVDSGPPPSSVMTTLDLATQRFAEQVLHERVDALGGRVRGGAVVVLDSRDGGVRAMVGSPSFDSPDAGQVNAALALRQPGSAVKPFTYVAAFAGSLRPSTILADVPTSYGDPTGVFTPQNYAQGHAGPTPARLALANSWNVPAVEALDRTGIEAVAGIFQTVQLVREGDAARLGLGLTLGAGEVTLLDLAAAYATLARGGVWKEPRGVIKAIDRSGRPMLRAACDARPSLDPVAVAWVNEILSDPAARSAAFARRGPLEVDGPVAAKTGTSSDWRDAWAVLYTTRHTVAVWMGNPDGSPTDEVAGALGPAVIAREIIDRLEEIEPSDPFPVPEGTEQRAVCPLSGSAAGPDCPQVDWAPFRCGDPPLSPCSVHVTRRIDEATGLLARDCTPRGRVRRALFVELPERFSFWQADHGLPRSPDEATECTCGSPECRPLDAREDRAPGRAPHLAILRPVDGTVLAIDPTLAPGQQQLSLEAVAPAKAEVVWRVDGQILGTTRGTHRIFWPVLAGDHRVEAAVVRAGKGREGEDSPARAEALVRVLDRSDDRDIPGGESEALLPALP